MKHWVEHRRHTGWRPMPVPQMTDDPRVLDLPWMDRSVFMLLWLVTDDAGRFTAHPRALAGRIGWPDTARKLAGALRRLAATGYIHLYEVDGQPFGELIDYADAVKLNNRQPGVYPAPVEGSPEARREASIEAHAEPSQKPRAQKEERRKEKEEKTTASSAGLSTGSVRERAHSRPEAEGEARPSLPVSLDPSLDPSHAPSVEVADDVKWPSPQVAMAVRQWRGQLAVHQQGQRDVAHVTDVSLLGLVERWGADTFERAVVRHVGESFERGLWSTPFAALAKRCKWMGDGWRRTAGGIVVQGEIEPRETTPIVPAAAEADDRTALEGSEPGWWPGTASALQATMSRTDWLTWCVPVTVRDDGVDIRVVCPDGAHATMFVERWGAWLAENMPGARGVVAVTLDGEPVQVIRERRAA